MNNREAIEYLKEKNNQALNNKNLLLEKYRENGQDVFEKADPLYLKKIGVTYPTTGDIDEEDIAEYRNELSELIGEFITSISTTKELLNDMDDDEVTDMLVNWENVYKRIFESLEGQTIDYKRLRETINKRVTERMYLERQSKKLKEEMGNKNPVTTTDIKNIVEILPSDIEVKNNVAELSSEFIKFFQKLNLLYENDKSMAKLATNLHKYSKNTEMLEHISAYLNNTYAFERPERIKDIVSKYETEVYNNGLVNEFKRFCNKNGISPPISVSGVPQREETMIVKLNTLTNDQLRDILQFIDVDVPQILAERLRKTRPPPPMTVKKSTKTVAPPEEEDETERLQRDREARLRRDEEERIRRGDELISQLQPFTEVVEGPGEKGEPNEDTLESKPGYDSVLTKDGTVLIPEEDILKYGDVAFYLVFEYWASLDKQRGLNDTDLNTKYFQHQGSDIYKYRLKTAIDGLKQGLDEETIKANLVTVKQIRTGGTETKKETVSAKKTTKKVETGESIGKGLRSKLKPHQKAIKDKYYIDLKKLNANILEIRYTANKHLTGIKSQRISSNVREIILSMADGIFDEDLFKKATKSEQNLIRNIARLFKIDIDDDGDDEFDKEFEILIGQYESGNDSELLRKKIKSYISHGMKIGRITRKHGYDMLLEMSL